MDDIQRFTAVTQEMMAWYADCRRRVDHFLKVWAFARQIGLAEGLDAETQYILDVTAVMHDIGIKPAEEQYHSSSGKYQELLGPGAARPLLEKYGFSPERTDRICFLISHHHTYDNIDADDWQILVEADFLVNAYEEPFSGEAIARFRDRVFKTAAGIKCLDTLYPGEVR